MLLHQRIAQGSQPAAVGGVWRAEIVEALSNGMVWVRVPGLMGDEPVGPLPVFGGPQPDIGVAVLVFAVGGRTDDLVVLPPAG